MALEVYRKKRNFKNTPEPEGKVLGSGSTHLSFVVQKHAASHLHYDFRLELNGVLLSWAVPKGPSLDPNDKRLAMHVEDHPKEYGGFEGVIPPKQYGSGTVMLWDQGTWLPTGDPASSYQKGKLKFQLQGKKLRGGWTLVRSHGSKYGEKSWLLIKEEDSFARLATEGVITETKPRSVLSGRTMDEIAAHPDRVWHSTKSVAENLKTGTVKKRRSGPAPGTLRGAVKGALAPRMSVQLATLINTAPLSGEWLHEIKLDGYRMLCRVEKGACRMYSRTGKDWTAEFSTIAQAAARLPCTSAWIDGEVVVLADDGRTSFQALQNALSQGSLAKLHYYAFDLPYLDGYDLSKAALLDRKRVLQTLLQSTDELKFSDHVVGAGEEVFAQACKLGLEGIISKRVDSAYQPVRGANWVKTKCGMRQEMVVGGFTDPQNSRIGFGALLLGVYDHDGSLRYAGKVGTGFDDATLTKLRSTLDGLAQSEPPFVNPPTGAEGRRAHWVAPKLVAEVAFTEWTQDETLRHAAFLGLRADKRASDVIRERPKATEAIEATEAESDPMTSTKPAASRTKAPRRPSRGDDANTIAGITISNPGKPLFPEAQLTKRDLALYYHDMSEWILPHLKNRPVTLVRCPDGWEKECFYQKNATDSVAQVIDRVKVQTSDGPAQYMMANSTSALVALLQMGALELHPWGSQAPKLGFPDRIVFDFDPDEDLAWEKVKEATEILRTLLGEIGLQGFLKTTGGKGLHVVVPIQPTLPWDQAKAFAKAIASLLVRTFPDRFTAKLLKSTRQGKIFVDYLRNGEGATAVSP
ncbi:MAG: DNA ligase D, partial [Betaproteobacteria bacterium]|nr:DNA ligase D [Betaproteobacteria bacterium]